ncbi:MAG: hypothetical protein KDK07_24890 [Bauldia sp.]|nr:hypothetical protein [Bauldia sp.]
MDTSGIGIAVTLAVVAGVALLVAGAIAARRGRQAGVQDHAPLIWAAAILLQLAMFWWGFEQMAAPVDVWTVPSLLFVAARAFALVVAAALVLPLRPLPPGETSGAAFAARGRRALIALAAFHLLAVAVLLLAGEWLLGEEVRLDLVLLVLTVAGFLGGRRVPALAGGAYGLAMVWSVLQPVIAP